MRPTLVSLAAAAAALALTAGCGAVDKVTSCGRVIGDAVSAATLLQQGDYQQLHDRSGEYAASFRDAADKAADPAVATALNNLAADIEAVGNVDFNQPYDPQTVQLLDRIPINVEALQRSCTDFS